MFCPVNLPGTRTLSSQGQYTGFVLRLTVSFPTCFAVLTRDKLASSPLVKIRPTGGVDIGKTQQLHCPNWREREEREHFV
jgi:hypothetical protein